MDGSIESTSKLTVKVGDKYLKDGMFIPDDALVTGAIKCLREQGKVCEYFGLNILNGHVVVIDGIKYYTSGTALADTGELAFSSIISTVANIFSKLIGSEKLNENIRISRSDMGVLDIRGLSYEVFHVVDDTEHDYKENYLKDRVGRILDALGDK